MMIRTKTGELLKGIRKIEPVGDNKLYLIFKEHQMEPDRKIDIKDISFIV